MPETSFRIRREVDLILGVLRESKQPLSVGEIAQLLRTRHRVKLAPYTVAYRLRLAPPDTVLGEGEGRGRRYRIRPRTAAPSASDRRVEVAERATPFLVAPVESWLSPEGARVIAKVRVPRGERRYVGYMREWLESYVPNQTTYLTPTTRAHLHQKGRTSQEERPAGSYARAILARLLIDLSWASSRLEGNTYSRLDTQNLIEFGQRAQGKDETETQMILNHKAAIEFLVDGRPGQGLDAGTIRSLHATLSEGLLPDSRDEGRLRLRPVRISGSTYIPTEDPHVIVECFDRIVATANAISDPFERSFFLLVHLPYLQPFADVNKRTARLAANIPLVDADLCPLTFVDVPEADYASATLCVYELRATEPLRDLYVWAYERSAEQYVIVRDATAKPHPLRLRYRQQLREVLGATIRDGEAPDRAELARRAREHAVRDSDMDAFVELALGILLNLNDASATRYDVRPSEFAAWRARFTGDRPRD